MSKGNKDKKRQEGNSNQKNGFPMYFRLLLEKDRKFSLSILLTFVSSKLLTVNR